MLDELIKVLKVALEPVIVGEVFAQIGIVQYFVAAFPAVLLEGLLVGFFVARIEGFARDRDAVHPAGCALGGALIAVEPLVEVEVILEKLVFVAVAPGFGFGVHCANLPRLCDGPLDDAVGEVELGSLGVIDARLEGGAQGHEFVDFGDNAVLFGKWC